MTVADILGKDQLFGPGTRVVIRGEIFEVLWEGHWAQDGLYDYRNFEVESFTWDNTDGVIPETVYIDLFDY